MSSNDDHDPHLATPSDFVSETFAFNNRQIFDEVIALRVQGASMHVAYRMVLGEEYNDNMATARVYAMEQNPYFKREFKFKLESTPFTELWNPKTAVHELLSLVRDKWAKESARLSAMKELNVIANITIIDESGKTRAGRKLSDFYAEEGNELAPTPDEPENSTDAPPTQH